MSTEISSLGRSLRIFWNLLLFSSVLLSSSPGTLSSDYYLLIYSPMYFSDSRVNLTNMVDYNRNQSDFMAFILWYYPKSRFAVRFMYDFLIYYLYIATLFGPSFTLFFFRVFVLGYCRCYHLILVIREFVSLFVLLYNRFKIDFVIYSCVCSEIFKFVLFNWQSWVQWPNFLFILLEILNQCVWLCNSSCWNCLSIFQ